MPSMSTLDDPSMTPRCTLDTRRPRLSENRALLTVSPPWLCSALGLLRNAGTSAPLHAVAAREMHTVRTVAPCGTGQSRFARKLCGARPVEGIRMRFRLELGMRAMSFARWWCRPDPTASGKASAVCTLSRRARGMRLGWSRWSITSVVHEVRRAKTVNCVEVQPLRHRCTLCLVTVDFVRG
jgi:hypothetical protein